jgi:hypothetical protein
VAVATEKGNVKLSARAETVQVRAGQQSLVRRGMAPSPPQALPASLFLKVGRPPGTLHRREVTVRGETVPGAVVKVNGVTVAADDTGAFAARVPLVEGANKVVLQAVDVLGRRQTAALERVLVDTRAPGVKGEVEW